MVEGGLANKKSDDKETDGAALKSLRLTDGETSSPEI
jgi:hypothetical protein